MDHVRVSYKSHVIFFVSLTPSKFNIATEKWLLEDNHSLLNFRWVNQNPIYHLPTTTGPEFSSLFNLGVTLSHFVASIHALQILSLQPGVFGSDSCGWPAIPPDVPGVLGMFFTGPNTEPQEVFWMFRVFWGSPKRCGFWRQHFWLQYQKSGGKVVKICFCFGLKHNLALFYGKMSGRLG